MMMFLKWGAIALKFSAAALLASAVLLGASASASASSCSVGDSGVTYNRGGVPAKFKSLAPMSGMNCASAKYVMNKWLRRAYARTYSYRLPRRFWDGYVTWTCYKRSSLRWQCDEYDSGTSFRFVAYRL
jgi:hypothetical protein